MKTAASSDRAGDGIRAVVWDLDGTLIDTECVFAEAARRLLARRGIAHDSDFMATMRGTPGRDALPRFRDRYGLTNSIAEIADEYKRSFLEALENQPARLMPGALELLDWLEAHAIPKAIATSSNRQYVAGVFAPLQLVPRFEFVLTIDDVTNGKPDPEIYLMAAQRLGVAPSQIAVIEDSIAGYESAVAAGTKCIVVGNDADHDFQHAVLTVPSLDSPLIRELFQVSR